MSTPSYRIRKGSKIIGPLTREQVADLLAQGRIAEADLISDNDGPWLPLPQVLGSLAARPVQPTPTVLEPPPPGEPLYPLQEQAAHPPTVLEPRPPRPEPEPEPAEAPGHLLDVVLQGLRAHFPPDVLDAFAQAMIAVGNWGLLVAMVLGLVFTVACERRLEQASIYLWGLGGVAGALLLHYLASKFSQALLTLMHASPSRVSSTVVMDCFALFALLGGLGAFLYLSVETFQDREYNTFLLGLGTFFACAYLACVALSPATLNIRLQAGTSAGEEAVAVLTFLLKIFLQLVPVVYGVGVVIGVLNLLRATYFILKGGPTVLAALPAALTGAQTILGCALLPVGAYFLFLFGYLSVELAWSLLALPRQLGAVAGHRTVPEEEYRPVAREPKAVSSARTILMALGVVLIFVSLGIPLMLPGGFANYRVSIASLLDEYVRDETLADRKYRNNFLTLRGTVAGVEGLTLVLQDSDLPFLEVTCSLRPEYGDRLPLLPGRLVTVKGTCAGLDAGRVRLIDCDLIGQPTVALRAPGQTPPAPPRPPPGARDGRQ